MTASGTRIEQKDGQSPWPGLRKRWFLVGPLIKMEDAMIVVRIVQLLFLLLLIFLVCNSVVGEKEGPFWFSLTVLVMGGLFLARKIAQSRR